MSLGQSFHVTAPLQQALWSCVLAMLSSWDWQPPVEPAGLLGLIVGSGGCRWPLWGPIARTHWDGLSG